MRRVSRRRFITTAAAAPIAFALAACVGSDDRAEGVEEPSEASLTPTAPPATEVPTEVPTETPTETPTASPTSPPASLELEGPSGFTMPIAGATLPTYDAVMPNAPREYRNGVHEGVDFYPGNVGVEITWDTPVRAMQDGVVIRADLDYEDLTADQVEELGAKTAEQGYSDPETLDIYRGRQVWIDHGGDIVTRYCHLNSIADGIEAGAEVSAGEVIGGVGESGTPESITDPGTEVHLHAEVRIGGSFLGADLPPEHVRALYQQLFGPA